MTRLYPRPITLPSASTTMAPTGTSPACQASMACSMASAMRTSSPGCAGSRCTATAFGGTACGAVQPQRLPASSTTVHPGLQDDAVGHAGERDFEQLVELGVRVISGLVQVRDPPLLDKAPGAAAPVAMLGIPDPEGDAAGALDQRKARDVRIAVADEDHLVERHAQPVFRHLAVDVEGFAARWRADDAFLDVEQVARLVGKADHPAGKRDGALLVIGEFRRPDVGELGRDRRVAHDVADAARNQVELDLHLRVDVVHDLA